MNNFFLFLSILCSLNLFAGAFASKPQPQMMGHKDNVDVAKPNAGKPIIIQITPIKGFRGGSSEFLKRQLVKSAIRHITRIEKYQLAFGKVLPKTKGNTLVENLNITLTKNPNKDSYRLVIRLFELERNTLVKKVAQSELKEAKLIQQAELMFQELFLDDVVSKDPIPE